MKQNESLIERLSPEILMVTKTSPMTGRNNTMSLPITESQWADFMSGMLVQKALPDLTPSQAEFVLTGHTQKDWDKLFPPGMED